MMVEQWNSGTVMMEQRNNYGGTVEQIWWTSGTMMVKRRNNDGGTVEQI